MAMRLLFLASVNSMLSFRKARSGLNPRTMAKLNIPETKAPKFSAAKSLKESIK